MNGKYIQYFLTMLFIMLINVVTGYSEDIHIGKTSIKISNNSSFLLKNSMLIDADALVWNEGTVFLKNNNDATLDINAIVEGDGIWYFNGNADYTIQGDDAGVTSLDMESGYTLYVTNNLSVSGVLTLGDGLISVSADSYLEITDTASDAIVFSDNYYNSSFIEGELKRNTTTGAEYVFPVGSYSEGFHPFKVQNISSAGYFSVTFSDDYGDIWNSGVHNNVTLEEPGVWYVNTDTTGVTFLPYLSLYTTTGLMNDSYNLFYTDEPDEVSPDFFLDYNSQKSDDGAYLTTQTNYSSGLLAINKVETTTSKEGDEIPELINFVAKNGTGRTTFQIPGIEDYQKVSLSVYNRLGVKVYESKNYANDFDVVNYREGTYYYELRLITNEGEKLIERNIIEIVEY